MESLCELSPEFMWSAVSPPANEFVLINDSLASDGSFLLHHFISLYLKGGHSVCLVTAAQPLSHYDAISRKFGGNIGAAQDRFRCIDALSMVHNFSQVLPVSSSSSSNMEQTIKLRSGSVEDSAPEQPSCFWRSLYRSVCTVVETLDNSIPDSVCCVIVDDISVLRDVWGVSPAGTSVDMSLEFLKYCRNKMTRGSVRGALIVLQHVDCGWSGDNDEGETAGDGACLRPEQLGGALQEEASAVAALKGAQHLSDVVMEVRPLRTGYAKDVHGSVTITRRPKVCVQAGTAAALATLHRQFKVTDNTVKVFEVGSGGW